MQLDITEQNQISPRNIVEIRTSSLRVALRDLREHGREIARTLTTSGKRIVLDDGTELSITWMAGSEPRTSLTNTAQANTCEENPKSYPIYPR